MYPYHTHDWPPPLNSEGLFLLAYAMPITVGRCADAQESFPLFRRCAKQEVAVAVVILTLMLPRLHRVISPRTTASARHAASHTAIAMSSLPDSAGGVGAHSSPNLTLAPARFRHRRPGLFILTRVVVDGSVNEVRQGNARVVIGPKPQRKLAWHYKGPVAPKAIVGNAHPGDRRIRVDSKAERPSAGAISSLLPRRPFL